MPKRYPQGTDLEWNKYRDADSSRNTSAHYQAFRDGYRRGMAVAADLELKRFIRDNPEEPGRLSPK